MAKEVADQLQSQAIITPGWLIRIFNALAVGILAAFSLEKIFLIAGLAIMSAAWPIAVMVASGLVIFTITYMMYPKDAWQEVSASWEKWWTTRKAKWGTSLDSSSDKQSRFQYSDGYGHLGGLVKCFVAFAGAWLLLASFGLPLALTLVTALLVGGAQYFVESAELIPHSEHVGNWLYRWATKPKEKQTQVSPTHNHKTRAVTTTKWVLAIGHGLGQGLGVFACLAILAPFSPPLAAMLFIGVLAAIIIGPSTSSFYGKPFFRSGSEISLSTTTRGGGEESTNEKFYDRNAIIEALTNKGLNAAQLAKISTAGERETQQRFSKDETEAMLNKFGYYLKADNGANASDKQTSASAYRLYLLGGVIGCLGAGFKGALAFAGTVVFFTLIFTGSLALSITPPGWVFAIATLVGLATWIVQCSRACPNTAEWFMKKFSAGKQTGDAGHRAVPTTTPTDPDQFNTESESQVRNDEEDGHPSGVNPADTSFGHTGDMAANDAPLAFLQSSS